MFVLDKSKVYEKNQDNLIEFIECWNKYYNEEKIDYLTELNLKNNLTENNLNALITWKDHRFLALYSSDIIKKLPKINAFRNGQITEDDIKNNLMEIWTSGIIYPVFILHIARPFEYPLADVNVYQAFITIKTGMPPKDKKSKFTRLDEYEEYKKFFFDLAISAKLIEKQPNGDEENIKDIVEKLKKLDNALLAYGQFLIKYG